MRKKIAFGCAAVAVLFGSCGEQTDVTGATSGVVELDGSRQESTASSAAPTSLSLAPPTDDSPEPDEPWHGAYTVEDLARVSDAVVLTSGVSVLERVQIGGSGFLVAEFAVDRVLRGDSLSGASTVVAWVVDEVVPEASLSGRHVVFLVEAPVEFDEEGRDALERFGGRHVLLSGPLAVLDVDGDTVSSDDDSFRGLRSLYVVPPPGASAPDETTFGNPGRWDRPALDDVIAVIEEVGVLSPSTTTVGSFP